jgi:GAF domain-containing protein
LVQVTSPTDRAGLAEEQAALRRVATLVAQQPSPQEVFTAVTEAVGPLLGADLAAMLVFRGDGTVTTIAGWGAAAQILPIGTRLPLDGDSVAARIFHSGAPARIDSYAGIEGETADVARGLRLRSTVGAPILVGGRLWGALMAARRSVEPLPEDAERRIAAFTEPVATAIANAAARRELERVAAEQQAFRSAATLVASGAAGTEVFAAITTSASDVGNARAFDGGTEQMEVCGRDRIS